MNLKIQLFCSDFNSIRLITEPGDQKPLLCQIFYIDWISWVLHDYLLYTHVHKIWSFDPRHGRPHIVHKCTMYHIWYIYVVINIPKGPLKTQFSEIILFSWEEHEKTLKKISYQLREKKVLVLYSSSAFLIRRWKKVMLSEFWYWHLL